MIWFVICSVQCSKSSPHETLLNLIRKSPCTFYTIQEDSSLKLLPRCPDPERQYRILRCKELLIEWENITSRWQPGQKVARRRSEWRKKVQSVFTNIPKRKTAVKVEYIRTTPCSVRLETLNLAEHGLSIKHVDRDKPQTSKLILTAMRTMTTGIPNPYTNWVVNFYQTY